MTGVLQEHAHGDEHRALARGRGTAVRLTIWRGTGLAAKRAPAAAGAADLDIARLYEHEAPRLRRRLARRMTPDKAADLVQATFLRLLRLGEDRLAELDRPQAYLGRVAENLAKDAAKSSVRRSEHLHEDVDCCELATGDPHVALEARDLLRRIETAIALLPGRTREIFMAHRFEDLTYSEIADRMGISIKTVEKHISLALRELHRSLGSAT
jgi:RNA polymerase sigma-70 factor (ECF subfamily)